MNTCPVCNGPMKPLFTSMYCPADCDRVFKPTVIRDKDAGYFSFIPRSKPVYGTFPI